MGLADEVDDAILFSYSSCIALSYQMCCKCRNHFLSFRCRFKKNLCKEKFNSLFYTIYDSPWEIA